MLHANCIMMLTVLFDVVIMQPPNALLVIHYMEAIAKQFDVNWSPSEVCTHCNCCLYCVLSCSDLHSYAIVQADFAAATVAQPVAATPNGYFVPHGEGFGHVDKLQQQQQHQLYSTDDLTTNWLMPNNTNTKNNCSIRTSRTAQGSATTVLSSAPTHAPYQQQLHSHPGVPGQVIASDATGPPQTAAEWLSSANTSSMKSHHQQQQQVAGIRSGVSMGVPQGSDGMFTTCSCSSPDVVVQVWDMRR